MMVTVNAGNKERLTVNWKLHLVLGVSRVDWTLAGCQCTAVMNLDTERNLVIRYPTIFPSARTTSFSRFGGVGAVEWGSSCPLLNCIQ